MCSLCLCVCLRPRLSVFLCMTTADTTSEGKTGIIKVLDSIHLGRWDTNTGWRSCEKDTHTHTHTHINTLLFLSELINDAFLLTGSHFLLPPLSSILSIQYQVSLGLPVDPLLSLTSDCSSSTFTASRAAVSQIRPAACFHAVLYKKVNQLKLLYIEDIQINKDT